MSALKLWVCTAPNTLWSTTMLRGARSLIARPVAHTCAPEQRSSPLKTQLLELERRVAALEVRFEELKSAAVSLPPPKVTCARSCPSTPCTATSPARFDWSPEALASTTPESPILTAVSPPAATAVSPAATSPPPASPTSTPDSPAPTPDSPAPTLVLKGQSITTRESLDKLRLVELKVNELHQLCTHFNIEPPKRCKKQSLITLLSNME